MSQQKRKKMFIYKPVKIKTRNFKDLKVKLKHFRPLKGKSNEIIVNSDHDRRIKYDKLIIKMDDQRKINIIKYIVKLYAYFEYENIDMEGRGSGFIIDVNNDSIWVLTCAHVVKIYSRLDKEWYSATDIWFFDKKLRNTFKATEYVIYTKFKTYSDGNDIALIKFENIGLKKSSLLPYISNVDLWNQTKCKGYVLGYPGEIESNQVYGMDGEITLNHKKHKNILLYKIDTTQGQSGSIILGRKYKVGYRIIGIHSDGDNIGNINSGVKMNSCKCRWIQEIILESTANNQNNAPYVCKIQSDTFEDKPIRTWTCNDVEEWLISLGTKFETKCIDEIVNQVGLDGDALCDMDDSDWNEVHINKILKNIIKKKINALKYQ